MNRNDNPGFGKRICQLWPLYLYMIVGLLVCSSLLVFLGYSKHVALLVFSITVFLGVGAFTFGAWLRGRFSSDSLPSKSKRDAGYDK